jgi:hypothetical protein
MVKVLTFALGNISAGWIQLANLPIFSTEEYHSPTSCSHLPVPVPTSNIRAGSSTGAKKEWPRSTLKR